MGTELADHLIARLVEFGPALEHHPYGVDAAVVMEVGLAAVLAHDLDEAAAKVAAGEADGNLHPVELLGLSIAELADPLLGLEMRLLGDFAGRGRFGCHPYPGIPFPLC